MVVPKRKNVSELLKDEILEKEKKKIYYSNKFLKIEEKVKESLRQQKTDDALREIIIWALVLWWSDVHFETFEEFIIVRYRIDWILVDIFKFTLKEYKSILERIKYSSSLKLNIKNIPQDWKFSLIIDGRDIDVRVSTIPIWDNEWVVFRLLDNSKSVIDFDKLWFFWTTKRLIESSIRKKNWLILVTWPTWSGKTTTLYTMLSFLNTREKKLITLEDPIEYRLNWINQAEVDEKVGFTFKLWLRAILRHDPDIVMVWEIRDFETLDTATNASLTWHLVLSTLHTKSAAETLERLINMWLKPYIIASALDTIIAQRLVRKICPHCKIEKESTKLEKSIIWNMMKEIWITSLSHESIKLYEWKWCEKCNNSWYLWRIWIYEIISLNDDLRNLIRKWSPTSEIVKRAREWDLITMKEDGILKAIKGHTTIEEILRVI